ncbi:DUF190 domain-containing protein [Sphingobium sp. Z007]|jgi:PII-like signaling protein|uniref:DUF190 domain-containing protein n=1 Tax=Sphingobium sp. Z007 TaxID=627495 RepID=UPI000B4A4C0F|nr:DUF190 domain-containing protein [Sphingobium sp. Z007]
METKLLRVYTDESAYFGDRKVFQEIAARAKDARLAGVTILEALIGFGKSAHIHQRHVLESDRAVVIEIVDLDSSLRAFVESLSEISGIGLMTLEAVEVLGGKARDTIAQADA